MSDVPSKLSLFQYSFLALPLAFAGLPLYVHAPDFYTRDLGVSIGLIGIVLLVIRLLDAFQDPVIGYLSDKHANKRFGIIAFGSALLVIGMASVFYGPQLGIPTLAWFAGAMICATSGFSIVTINLNMIGGFWYDSPGQRTRISAWREAFALVGLLIASVLPAALQNFKPAEDAFRILFWVFSVVIVAAFIMFTRFMGRISPGHKITKSDTKKGLSFLSILTGPDRNFFGVCFLTHLAAALPGVMVLFFIRDYLGADNLAGLFLFLYFIAGAALMAVWVKLADKIGKKRAWLASMLLAVATFIWAFFLEPGDVVAYGIICVLSGMALGADLALPPSILADRVTEQKTEAEATQYYALIAFIPKTAIAIASGVSFLILDHLGFVAGEQNSPEVLEGVITLYALIPCLIKLCAAFWLWQLYKHEGDIYEYIERSGSHGTHGIS
jgi:Na+/melibiose symporter-like transporter